MQQNRSSSTFQQIFHFYFPCISNNDNSYIFVKTNVPCCTHWQGKQKYQAYKLCHICCNDFKPSWQTVIVSYFEVKNNCCLFERLFKVKKNGVFLFGISFFVLEIFRFLYYANDESDDVSAKVTLLKFFFNNVIIRDIQVFVLCKWWKWWRLSKSYIIKILF